MRALPKACLLAPLTLAGLAHAHEGHGLFGSHWHATDTLGLLLAVVALGLWLSRK